MLPSLLPTAGTGFELSDEIYLTKKSVGKRPIHKIEKNLCNMCLI